MLPKRVRVSRQVYVETEPGSTYFRTTLQHLISADCRRLPIKQGARFAAVLDRLPRTGASQPISICSGSCGTQRERCAAQALAMSLICQIAEKVSDSCLQSSRRMEIRAILILLRDAPCVQSRAAVLSPARASGSRLSTSGDAAPKRPLGVRHAR